MTNPDKTLIGVLLDRSGSMISIKEDMEGGIKSFLNDQYKLGQTDIAIAQFDHVYQLVTPIRPLAEDETITIVPRSRTALNDAVGQFVTYLGEELFALEEADRPGKVIVVIITDGAENGSKEWKLDQVKELIRQQEGVYKWEFIFMGSDLTTETQAREYGIRPNRVVRYATEGVDCGAQNLSMMTSHIRQN